MSNKRTNAQRLVVVGSYGCFAFGAIMNLCVTVLAQSIDTANIADSPPAFEGQGERRDGAWLKNAIAILPPGVPADAQEVKSGVKLLFAEGVGPERIELGTLQTGTHYFTEIEFVNMLDRPIRVTDIKSSCGCLAASKIEQEIKSGKSSSLLAILSPQMQNGKYAKSLTIMTDAGITLPILIAAEFKQPFSISPDNIQISDRSQPILLTIRTQSMRDAEDLSFKPITGSLKVRETRSLGPGEWEILCTASVDVVYAVRPIAERFAVTRTGTGKTICELNVVLDTGEKIVARPDRIRLRGDGDEYAGRILLFGDLSNIDWTQSLSVALDVEGVPPNKRVAANAEIAFRSSKMARIDVRWPKAVGSELEAKSAKATVFLDGSPLCSVGTILFPEE